MTIEELEGYGLERMNAEEIESFLDGQSHGVLGLPDDPAPYLLPLSYAFDGTYVYFTYLRGRESRKERLSDRADRATFLVYSVETMFNWRSVLLEGDIRAVPESRWSDLEDVLADTWRPELIRMASTERRMAIYRLRIDEQSGLRHTGLSPEFTEPSTDD
ncbi:MAG: pyridoxamine 5'-phosphate oxidase family protein [Halapricum sp.]